MNTNNETGRKICVGIGAYLIVKCVLNMIIGGGLDISGLLIAAAMFCALWSGIKYVNYVVAGILAVIALIHMPDNISRQYARDPQAPSDRIARQEYSNF